MECDRTTRFLGVLTAALILSFAACGENSDSSASSGSSSPSSSTPSGGSSSQDSTSSESDATFWVVREGGADGEFEYSTFAVGLKYLVEFPRTAEKAVVLLVETGNEVGHLRGDQWKIHAVAYSVDGSRVAMVGKDGLIELWDPDAATRKAVLKEHEGPAYSVTFSGDGKRLVSGGKDGTVRVWAMK